MKHKTSTKNKDSGFIQDSILPIKIQGRGKAKLKKKDVGYPRGQGGTQAKYSQKKSTKEPNA